MSRAALDYPLVIAGGGIIGASLACGLGGRDVRVGLIEAIPPGSGANPSYDDRAVALSEGSRRILEGLGVWDSLADDVSPIRSIHVSDRGRFGFTRLVAAEHGVKAFGYVTAARRIGVALARSLAERSAVDEICPATVESVIVESDRVRVTVRESGRTREISAALLAVADGGDSPVRELLSVGARRRDYRQSALTANVTPSLPHRGVAYERFTEAGPLAVLPMSANRCGVVWTLRPPEAERLLGADEGEFLRALGRTFGRRLGDFVRVGERRIYPLCLVRAARTVMERVAIIGNAAHALHPVAGQGSNLGLRDVATLCEVIMDALREGADPGSRVFLDRYEQWRRDDGRSVTWLTDGLVRLFSNRSICLATGRDLGLIALDIMPWLKGELVQGAMGLRGRQPRLSRGVPL